MTAILGNVVKEKAHMHARNFAQGKVITEFCYYGTCIFL